MRNIKRKIDILTGNGQSNFYLFLSLSSLVFYTFIISTSLIVAFLTDNIYASFAAIIYFVFFVFFYKKIINLPFLSFPKRTKELILHNKNELCEITFLLIKFLFFDLLFFKVNKKNINLKRTIFLINLFSDFNIYEIHDILLKSYYDLNLELYTEILVLRSNSLSYEELTFIENNPIDFNNAFMFADDKFTEFITKIPLLKQKIIRNKLTSF